MDSSSFTHMFARYASGFFELGCEVATNHVTPLSVRPLSQVTGPYFRCFDLLSERTGVCLADKGWELILNATGYSASQWDQLVDDATGLCEDAGLTHGAVGVFVAAIAVGGALLSHWDMNRRPVESGDLINS